MTFSVETSLGEILDRLSILEIKKSKGINVDTSYLDPFKSGFDDEYAELIKINGNLWDLEDKIRHTHMTTPQDPLIITLSKLIITNNHKRSEIKKQINDKIGQTNEPKKYTGFECS